MTPKRIKLETGVVAVASAVYGALSNHYPIKLDGVIPKMVLFGWMCRDHNDVYSTKRTKIKGIFTIYRLHASHGGSPILLDKSVKYDIVPIQAVWSDCVVFVRTICLTGVAILVMSVGHAQATDYTYTTINMPGALSTAVYGLNDAGQAVGIFGDYGPARGFLYDHGSFTILDYVAPGGWHGITSAIGINDLSQVVGAIDNGGSGFHAYTHQGTSFNLLNVSGFALGNNNSGIVVGEYPDGPGFIGFQYDPANDHLSLVSHTNTALAVFSFP